VPAPPSPIALLTGSLTSPIYATGRVHRAVYFVVRFAVLAVAWDDDGCKATLERYEGPSEAGTTPRQTGRARILLGGVISSTEEDRSRSGIGQSSPVGPVAPPAEPGGLRVPGSTLVGGVAGATLMMMGIPAIAADGEVRELWCDPLTGLVAYPSFAECLIESLPVLSATGVHLAIGDVDDLKEYVSQRRSEDPTMFGHRAGNQCMEVVGRVTTGWSHDALRTSTFALCGTFGGDEVIVAAAGVGRSPFVDSIRDLAQAIEVASPRTCSFSVGTLAPGTISDQQAPAAYRQFVAAVDAALFLQKAELRKRNINPRGELKYIGDVRIDLPPLDYHGEAP